MIDYAPDLLTALFDRAMHPCFVFDRDTLELLHVNDAMCARYGWTRDELLRMTLRDIRLPEDVPRMEQLVAERRNMPGQLSLLSRHRTKSGDVMEVEVEMTRVRYAERNATVAIVHDITRASETARLFRMLVEMSSDGLAIIGEDRVMRYISPGGERILGVRSAEIVGTASMMRTHPDDVRKLVYNPPGETMTYLVRVRHGNGSYI